MLKELMDQLNLLAQRTQDRSFQAQIAKELGWNLVTGADATQAQPVLTLVSDADRAGSDVLENPEKYSQAGEEQRRALEAIQNFPGANLILDALQVVCGRLDDHDVYIFPQSTQRSGGGPNRRHLVVVVLLKESLKLKLHMYPERWYSRVGKTFFSLQDIQLSVSTVDEAFMIKSSEPNAARRLLREPSVLDALRSLVAQPYEVPSVNDVSVRTTLGEPFDLQATIDHLKAMTALAAALSRAQQKP